MLCYYNFKILFSTLKIYLSDVGICIEFKVYLFASGRVLCLKLAQSAAAEPLGHPAVPDVGLRQVFLSRASKGAVEAPVGLMGRR